MIHTSRPMGPSNADACISESSEYQLNQNGSVDISRRELAAPAGAQYLCRSGDGALNVRTNHRERFHVKAEPVERPTVFLVRPSAKTGNGITGVSSCRPDWRTRLPTASVRPIVLEYVGRTRRSMPSVRRNVNGSGHAPSASLRDTTRQWQPSRPSGFRKIAWPPTRKQNIRWNIMFHLIFPVVSFPLRPVRVIRRPFPVVPCPIADCRLSAFARRPAAWNVLHPTWRGREGVLWRMGKAGTVWRGASRYAVS